MSGVSRKAGKSEPKFTEQIRPTERASQVVLVVKNLHTNRGDKTWVPSLGQEDPLEEENGNPLQYSCLKNSMDRRAWPATVHEVTKSWT